MSDSGLVEPRSRSTDQRYYGVAEALVVDNLDPEGQGRVKVKFPWFDPGMDSEWCRVSNLYAGNDYGSFFVPEVGDEVLVAFIHGDMRLPIILGGLYNGQDLPPAVRDAAKDQKMIRTKGRHELLMDDTPGEEKVTVTTSGGHTVVLDDAGLKVTVETSGGQKILMEDTGGKITIETSTGASIVMDASGVTVTATSVTLSAASVGLGGSAGQPLVLGTALLAAFNAHTHISNIPTLPTGPPLPPLTPAVLSTVSKSV